MEIVYALVVSLMMNGEVRTTLYQAPSWKACTAAVKAFTQTPTPEGTRDARMTCVSSALDPLKGTRPI
jgi:hypothetical protein